MSSTSERQAAKAWRLRNSDGKHSWGNEYGQQRNIQAPPSFTETDNELPPGTVRLTNPDNDDDGRAVVMAHTWSAEEP